jgi:hypothetical protein
VSFAPWGPPKLRSNQDTHHGASKGDGGGARYRGRGGIGFGLTPGLAPGTLGSPRADGLGTSQ